MTQEHTAGDSRLIAIAYKLWPESAEMEGQRQFAALKSISQLLFLGPLAIAAIVWLVLRTDFNRLADNLDSLAILFVAMVLLLVQPFTVRIRLGSRGEEVTISNSLAPLVMWSTLFISGAAGLWAMLLAAVLAAIWLGWQLASFDQNPLWQPLSFLVEQIGIYLFSTMVAATIYLAAGGAFPITGVELTDWLPALATAVFGALFSGLLLIPVAVQMNGLSGAPNSAGSLGRFYLGAITLPLTLSPFAIIVAVLNAEGRALALVFILLGIYLVNRLAHHMSAAEARSRRLAHEFNQLEDLAKHIIAAPADGSTLPDVLASALPKLFPTDRVAIRIFEPQKAVAWTPFDINTPQETAGISDDSWVSLCQDKEFRKILPQVTLPGQRRSFGDALLAKILVEETSRGEVAAWCAGGVYLLRHKSSGRAVDSLAAVESLASQVGTALNRAESHARTMAFQKTQQELEFAGHVQTTFLPKAVPDIDPWQISAILISARQTSGDFYDFIPLDEGLTGLVVADVSDKGTGAALYMALSRTLLRTYAMESGNQPELALSRTNDRIRADAESDQFVTLIYGALDQVTGVFTYANAGHNPGFLLRAADHQVETLPKTGIPLGMFEGMAWQQAQVEIKPGDVLLLYSDGVSEAQNMDDEEYGEERLITVGQATLGQPPIEVQAAIIKDIKEFVGSAPQFDDITLMVIAREA